MIVTREGVALHAKVEGDGPPVVMVHGHTLDLRVWDDLAARLVGAGCRVVRYDLRGHGRSASPPARYGWADHAADLAAVITDLARPPVHVVGLSKGGGIALELAVGRPELLRSLLLVAPLVPDVPLSPELLDSFRRVARCIRGEGVQRAMVDVWLPHPLIASAAALPGARERLEAMLLTFPAGEYLASSRDERDREWRLPQRLAELRLPALVVCGERDVTDFVAMAALVAEEIPGARLEVVAGSGHLVPLERPAELATLALEFLLSG